MYELSQHLFALCQKMIARVLEVCARLVYMAWRPQAEPDRVTREIRSHAPCRAARHVPLSSAGRKPRVMRAIRPRNVTLCC